ncbi:MAG: aldehyde dehydrogenase family protein [Pseudomonadota bacterium]
MATIKVNNPFDGSLLDELTLASESEVETALETAHQAFLNRDNWLPAYERVAILERLVELMNGQVEALTQLAASEGGKPYMDSKVEVLRAINGVKLAIEHLPQIKGEQIPMGHTASSINRLAYTQREPIGVVASLSAFNHPLNLIVHQTVPAIAVGCPVIVKPAANTPLSCFKLVDLLYQAGLPKDWCQALLCDRSSAEKLATDSRVNYLSFIGSPQVGWMLNSKIAPGTRAALEHGGAAPVIVDDSADVEEMIPSLVKGGFYHAGQVCVSVQRVFVHENMVAEISDRLALAAKELIVGDPLDPKTEVGPLISHKEVERVDTWVTEAIDAGATALCGAERFSDSCYAPTVLVNPPDDAKVSQLEIFGPVICVYSYSELSDAIDRANALPFAFQAAVFTKQLDNALDISNRLNATAVMVNDHTAFRVDWMPFGGRDQSGLGMGGIPYTMHEMTREKMLVIKSDVL